MEINAKVYAIAEDREVLQQIGEILSEQTLNSFLQIDRMAPCAVLPLTRTWYGFSGRAEMTEGPAGWMDCLKKCARILMEKGAVLVEFGNTDAPDDELGYAYTTSGGNAGSGQRASLLDYRRKRGNDDVKQAITELMSERSEEDRSRACRRLEQKEAARKRKGDFEINEEGVLIRYRGEDTEVILPEGIREIGDSAFVDQRGVQRLICDDEPYDAPLMESLTIPDGVEKIGGYAFAYCLNLEKVEMADSVRSIGERAFEGCASLKSIRLSRGLTEIADCTFFLCENLKAIELPEGITAIGTRAFFSCWNLKKVTLPESLVRIGPNAFEDTDLSQIILPKGVAEVGKDAFPDTVVVKRNEHP